MNQPTTQHPTPASSSSPVDSRPLSERLDDPNAYFTHSELFQAFELIGPRLGWYRDRRLPDADQLSSIETASMIVGGFEKFGTIVVKPQTIQDSMVTIASITDRILGENLSPSDRTYRSAQAIAIARNAIVSPPGFVDKLLESTDPGDYRFFYTFLEEYGQWLSDRKDEAMKKKSSTATGSESASTLEIGETSFPQTPIGSF